MTYLRINRQIYVAPSPIIGIVMQPTTSTASDALLLFLLSLLYTIVIAVVAYQRQTCYRSKQPPPDSTLSIHPQLSATLPRALSLSLFIKAAHQFVSPECNKQHQYAHRHCHTALRLYIFPYIVVVNVIFVVFVVARIVIFHLHICNARLCHVCTWIGICKIPAAAIKRQASSSCNNKYVACHNLCRLGKLKVISSLSRLVSLLLNSPFVRSTYIYSYHTHTHTYIHSLTYTHLEIHQYHA